MCFGLPDGAGAMKAYPVTRKELGVNLVLGLDWCPIAHHKWSDLEIIWRSCFSLHPSAITEGENEPQFDLKRLRCENSPFKGHVCVYSASPIQDGESDPGLDEDGKAKFKRKPRPEPLIIPPPKPSTFIPPSRYSTITSYQSHLRSPVRLVDNPLTLPPYTPPPILSPVREGSGLYFSTFLTNIAVTNQILPPPPTPKSAARSLLRSSKSPFFCSYVPNVLLHYFHSLFNKQELFSVHLSASSDITPPLLSLNTEATPVSLEP